MELVNEELLQIAAGIAAELGNGWIAEPGLNPQHCTLVGLDRWVYLSVSFVRNKPGRVFIGTDLYKSGIEYQAAGYETRPEEVGLSIKRSSAALARDIRRRMVTAAEKYFAACYVLRTEWQERVRTMERNTSLLVEVSRGGLQFPIGYSPENSDVSLRATQDVLGSYGHFRLIGTSSVEINLRGLSLQAAAAVAELLATFPHPKDE